MNHEEAGHYWNENAEVWTKLARSGYDVYRDYLAQTTKLSRSAQTCKMHRWWHIFCTFVYENRGKN